MGRLLALEVDPATLDALAAHAPDLGVTIEAVEADPGLRALEQHPAEVSVVVVGRVPDPVRVAQQTQMAAPDVPVMVVGDDEDCRAFGERLRLTAFVGPEVRCVPAQELVAELRGAIDRHQRRRRYEATVGALNRKLADAPSPEPNAAAAFLGRLLEVAPIGVVMVDPAAMVRAINPRARQLLEASGEPRIGARFDELLPREARERLRVLLADADADIDPPPSMTFQLPGREDRLRHLELTAAPLGAASGGPGYLLVLQDVSEQQRLLEQLREANRRKDDFIAMLGHELRNPLAPIRTALELLRLQADARTDRLRAMLERQVQHLVVLVDDLLDVSRITRGKIELSRRPVELGAVIAEAIEMASPLVEQRRHTLRVDVPRTGLCVLGDPRRLAQVVANLLTNAAKYTDPGGRIDVSARREGDQVVIAVRDSGRGIDPAMLPHVFDLFVQAPQGLDRASGGLGIGLSIVRSLVQLHGGTVEAQSEPGRGSLFEVRLPLHHGEPAAQARPAPARGAAPPPGAVRVLVVDDNEDAAALLAEMLEANGYATEVAHDGPSALAAAARFCPRIALLDLGLPVMDGYELADRLRALGFPELELVAVTGYGTEADRQRTREAGFVDHLVKPITSEAVLDALERLGGEPTELD